MVTCSIYLGCSVGTRVTRVTHVAQSKSAPEFCLEMVQRSAAGIIMQIRRGDRQSMTTILLHLHWLPVRKRIEYKLLVLVHRAVYDGTSEYLAALLLRCALQAGYFL